MIEVGESRSMGQVAHFSGIAGACLTSAQSSYVDRSHSTEDEHFSIEIPLLAGM
jgi:hypothetical protein